MKSLFKFRVTVLGPCVNIAALNAHDVRIQSAEWRRLAAGGLERSDLLVKMPKFGTDLYKMRKPIAFTGKFML